MRDPCYSLQHLGKVKTNVTDLWRDFFLYRFLKDSVMLGVIRLTRRPYLKSQLGPKIDWNCQRRANCFSVFVFKINKKLLLCIQLFIGSEKSWCHHWWNSSRVDCLVERRYRLSNQHRLAWQLSAHYRKIRLFLARKD